MIGLLGKKIGMTQVFTEDGKRTPVTVIKAGPCRIEQVKDKARDGYRAIKLALEEKNARKRFIREMRLSDDENYEQGSVLKPDIFKAGDFVDVCGTSIGKGFQGGVKRWHWKGGPKTHGSMSHRRPGSIGSSTFPSRVFRGHHLPGRMGGDRVTVQNLRIVKIAPEENLIAVKGAVPGCKNGYVIIKKAIKHIEKETRNQ